MPVAFDTLAYARRLREIGFDERQAEGMTQALVNAMAETLATKEDLRGLGTELHEVESALRTELHDVASALRTELRDVASALRTELHDVASALRTELHDVASALRTELRDVESRLRAEIENLRLTVKADMVALDSRLTLRLGAIMVAGIGVVSALVKLL